MVRYDDPRETGQTAAQRFAQTFWPEPRRIEKWDGPLFLLENGIAWYRLELTRNTIDIYRTPRKHDA